MNSIFVGTVRKTKYWIKWEIIMPVKIYWFNITTINFIKKDLRVDWRVDRVVRCRFGKSRPSSGCIGSIPIPSACLIIMI